MEEAWADNAGQAEAAEAAESVPAGPSGVACEDKGVQTLTTADAGVQYEPQPADGTELGSAALAAFLSRAAPIAEKALQQNQLADVLRDEFAGLADEDAQEGAADAAAAAADKVAVHQSFTDLVHSKGRAATAVQWHGGRRGVLAVAVADPLNLTERAQRRGQPAASAVLLWNYRDSMRPEAVLEAPSDVFALRFNPAQPQWLAAGCLGGQAVLWNLDQLAVQREQAARLQLGGSRRATAEHGPAGESAEAAAFLKADVLQPAHVSLLDASHQACVSDLLWLPGLAATRDGRLEPAATPTECNLFATVAIDGKVLVWDMRIHAGRRRGRGTATEDDAVEWKPVLTMPVQNSTSQLLSCTKLVVDARPSSTTRFVVGSLDGEMAVVDANIRAGDSTRSHNAVGHASSSCGRVLSLAHSPFLPNALLAVADCGFLVWQAGEALGEPLFESKFSEVYYTCGCWSPTKPGVILLGRLDGKLEIWDLLDRTHVPVVVASVSPAALMALAFSPGPAGAASRSSHHHVLAVTDAAGVLHLVDIPRMLRRRGQGEVKALEALLEREQQRLAYTQERQAARAKLQKEMEPKRRASIQFAQSATGPAAATKQQEGDAALDPEQRAELAYLELEKEWRAKLGLPPLEPPAGPATSRSSSAVAAK